MQIAKVAWLIAIVCFITGCKRSDSGSSESPQPVANSPVPANVSEDFLRLMNAGRNYLEQGNTTNAVETYRKAAALVPNDPDVHLNLAITHLMAGAGDNAIAAADEVLKLEPNSAAAYFVKGSAYLRLSNWAEAVKALENSRKIDPGETATLFQLGRARSGLQQWEEAIVVLREGITMAPDRLHTGPRYLLAQALLRTGREAEAEQELQLHQFNAEAGAGPVNDATFERSKFTQARVPFKLEQPEANGIPMRFVDATAEVLGASATNFSGPIGLVDPTRVGVSSVFVTDSAAGASGFRMLWNTNGTFQPDPTSLPGIPAAKYHKVLVGDLQNDRLDDVVVLGDKGSHVFRFETNSAFVDVSQVSGLAGVAAIDGTLMDLNFTGKLDLVAVTTASGPNSGAELKVFRQFGPLTFQDVTSTSGVPATLGAVAQVMMEDWNRDGNMDVIASSRGKAPVLLEKQRGGPLVFSEQTNWTSGAVFVAGDFDNDLRPDIAVVGERKITICFNSGNRREVSLAGSGSSVRRLAAIDYDGDGWLDLWAFGETLQALRNVGLSGFRDQTTELGLDGLRDVSEIHFADFDRDCDRDVILAFARGGLRYLRNEGGNANSQVTLQLRGNRSNASGLGCKVEIQTGGLRLIRTVHQLPVEVGIGKYEKMDSVFVHWFNWPQGSAEVPVDCKEPLLISELTIQEGSCPYVYVWDGKEFRFVTDILGAAPLGLPVAEGRYIEADPEELVWIGDEKSFLPRNGIFDVRITEELREVLYLDEASLVVVDREPGTEVHATDKLLPGKPFPPGELITLHRERPLLRAETLEGRDVTAALRIVDQNRVSPSKLRAPQLRGLAEPHGVLLDFGKLDADKPLVLVMNGWLRFGGGMANIAASHDPALPFPFPVLEMETEPGLWKPVDVTVGTPAGKTKTILVDLSGKLEPGTHRLRLTQAFEIHWDRIALLEEKVGAATKISFIKPSRADLQFRGFSEIQNLPSDFPLTPDYSKVHPNSYWTITPGGWCTRYGDVVELVAARDEGLAILNGGDELSLAFPESTLPSKSPGSVREYFLYADGWDKDSDFHVASGTQVEPLPFHGMDDQLYGKPGKQPRPAFPSDWLHQKYNTRWVEGAVLKQQARK